MLVMPSLALNPVEVVVIVGNCAADMGTIFKVPVGLVSEGLVVTVKGKDSVVIFVVAGMAL